MGRALSEKVGRGPCPNCGETITFRRSSGGMLTYKCDDCDSSGYAAPGGAHHQKMMTVLEQLAAPQADAAAKPKDAAPTAKKINSAFALGNL